MSSINNQINFDVRREFFPIEFNNPDVVALSYVSYNPSGIITDSGLTVPRGLVLGPLTQKNFQIAKNNHFSMQVLPVFHHTLLDTKDISLASYLSSNNFGSDTFLAPNISREKTLVYKVDASSRRGFEASIEGFARFHSATLEDIRARPRAPYFTYEHMQKAIGDSIKLRPYLYGTS